jgi:hypothetical protein
MLRLVDVAPVEVSLPAAFLDQKILVDVVSRHHHMW